jgi:hypothetical protein
MRYIGTKESWTEIDWSDWDYLLEDVSIRPKHSNLKTQAAKFIDYYKWRKGMNRKLLRELNKKAKKLRISKEKSLRSSDNELLKHIRWYLDSHRISDKYSYENIRS